jgi:hypothetical protein
VPLLEVRAGAPPSAIELFQRLHHCSRLVIGSRAQAPPSDHIQAREVTRSQDTKLTRSY